MGLWRANSSATLANHATPTPALQNLDLACAKIAETSLVLQLLAAGWRMMGQLVAVESLVFVLLRPRPLEQMHELLASSVWSLSSRLHQLGLVRSPLSLGEFTAARFMFVQSCA